MVGIVLLRIRENGTIRSLGPMSPQQLANGLWNRKGRKLLDLSDDYREVLRRLLARDTGDDRVSLGVNFSFYNGKLRAGSGVFRTVWLSKPQREYEGLQGLLDVESRLDRLQYRRPDDQFVHFARGLLPDGSYEPLDMLAP